MIVVLGKNYHLYNDYHLPFKCRKSHSSMNQETSVIVLYIDQVNKVEKEREKVS